MSIITPLIIIVIAMLIHGFLQLAPGTFSLFYHYALARKPAKIADNLSLNFILGVEVFVTMLWLIIYSLTFLIFYDHSDFCNDFFMWIMSGIFLAEAIAFFFFYYRKGRNTTLFIPRNIAKNIDTHARKVKTRSDAFILGFAISSLELIFTFPLYIILVVKLMDTSAAIRIIAVILFVTSALVPLFRICHLYRSDHNLAEITRSRVRAKSTVRFSVSFCFLLLAFTIIIFGVFYHG